VVTIPDYQTIMLLLLRFAADKREHSVREAIEELANHFGLTEDERKELLPSDSQATFDNRVGWARKYMRETGLLEAPRRGYFKITDRGLEALATNPETINAKFLEQYPGFREFRARSTIRRDRNKAGTNGAPPERTPLEIMEDAYTTIRSQLASDLLEQVMRSSPRFFEWLVVDLLVKMGRHVPLLLTPEQLPPMLRTCEFTVKGRIKASVRRAASTLRPNGEELNHPSPSPEEATSSLAAAAVVTEPPKGWKTRSPSRVEARGDRRTSLKGFWVWWRPRSFSLPGTVRMLQTDGTWVPARPVLPPSSMCKQVGTTPNLIMFRALLPSEGTCAGLEAAL
jgi:hypothetical protein